MNRFHHRQPRLATLLFLALSLFAAACGSSGDGGGLIAAETPEDALDNLDIDRTQTPRVDDQGDPLPDSYSPLGASCTLNRFAEIGIIGINAFSTADSRLFLAKEVPDASNNFDADLLTSVPTTELPWTESIGTNPANLRAAAAGDFDGDGIEEVALVYYELNDTFVRLITVDDESGGFARSAPIIVSDKIPDALSMEAGDFDGDGRKEVAVGLVLPTGVELVFLRQAADGLELTGDTATIAPQNADWTYQVAMASGNGDFDAGDELAVVLNETQGTEGRSSYVIYDDAGNQRAELSSGAVRAETGGEVFTAAVGDVSWGNIDGDPLDEVVFGGLTNISGTTTSIKSWGYLVYALDDIKRGFGDLGATQFTPDWQGLSESGQSLRLNYLHINTLDLDGDRIDEIQANQFVFEDFQNEAPWTEIAQIPNGEIIWGSGQGGKTYEFDNSAIAVGDVNADRREDIIFGSGAQSGISVWALDTIDGFSEIDRITATVSNQSRPIILTVNLDDDSVALEYSGGSYRFVFTEPVVIAALAAAPCNPSWGQNTDACRTAYGTAESTTVGEENSQTVTAGVTVGYSAEFSVLGVQIGSAEVLASVTAEATTRQGTAYTVTQTVEHTTGPIEDGVLFTTVPLDQYTYTILSHPNPELIGGEIVVSMPREPITALTTREFYNMAITPESFRVDERVFTHVPGDPDTYPTRGERSALLSQFEGIESREVDVGEGGGNVSVGVSVFEEVSMGADYSWNASLEVKTTAGGFVSGFTVGYGEGRSLSISAGSETSYTGTVSNLDAANFATNGFSFGLFSYVYDDLASGQQFEVLNYWVNGNTGNAP